MSLQTVLAIDDDIFMREVNATLQELRVPFVLFVSAEVSPEPHARTGTRVRVFRCFVNPWRDISGEVVACQHPAELVLVRFERWRASDGVNVKHYDSVGDYRGSLGDIRCIAQGAFESALHHTCDGIRDVWARPAGARYYFGIDTQGVL